jgi:ABC-type Fe3+/spermidine/putrescine transport system ATPase subunit
MDAHAKGARNGACLVDVQSYELEARAGGDVTGPAKIVIRPERIELEPHGSPPGPNRFPGMVERVVYVGSGIQVIVRAATGEALQALFQNTGKPIQYEQGTPVQIHLPAEALRVLPADIGEPAKDA